ncbi:hypothetical protein SEA_VANLEE_90 [Gordonia phage VanLee]|uniref:Uncharacterized protein n=1 Tax=Gordonia phage VanLee TaxID=2845816 RepID=A0A8F2DAE9_9CAUD|nr:hypothetical protein QEH49_gp090 [Gordonia phage VanLee]QWS68207.1 hypothetical protein SEA_VANLEE_90 [Gordonia phage VanLee]
MNAEPCPSCGKTFTGPHFCPGPEEGLPDWLWEQPTTKETPMSDTRRRAELILSTKDGTQVHGIHVAPVGTRLWFADEAQPYTVRASNVAFAVCTKPFNLRRTVLYTVVDWRNEIRGTENLVFGFGAETDEQCQEMLARLTAGESEVSYRNVTALNIVRSEIPEVQP